MVVFAFSRLRVGAFAARALPLGRGGARFAYQRLFSAVFSRFRGFALTPRGAGVAPVRGGTYFSLPPQRKVGKRKRANTANTSPCLRALNGSHTSHGVVLVRARCQRSTARITRFMHPRRHRHDQVKHVLRWQTVCRLSRITRFTPDGKAKAVFLVRARTCKVRRPTHSLPPGRHQPFAAAGCAAGD